MNNFFIFVPTVYPALKPLKNEYEKESHLPTARGLYLRLRLL